MSCVFQTDYTSQNIAKQRKNGTYLSSLELSNRENNRYDFSHSLTLSYSDCLHIV